MFDNLDIGNFEIRLQRGKVRSFSTSYTNNSTVYADRETLSFTIVNEGTTNIEAGVIPNQVTIVPNGQQIFGGYQGLERTDEVPIKFIGVGTNLAKVIRDKEEQPQKWIITKK